MTAVQGRMVSGLSAATAILQTNLFDDAMGIVRFAVMQGRQLFVMPNQKGDPDDPNIHGLYALAALCGSVLVEEIKTDVPYKKILLKDHFDKPLAIPIMDDGNHSHFLGELETLSTQLETCYHDASKKSKKMLR